MEDGQVQYFPDQWNKLTLFSRLAAIPRLTYNRLCLTSIAIFPILIRKASKIDRPTETSFVKIYCSLAQSGRNSCQFVVVSVISGNLSQEWS